MPKENQTEQSKVGWKMLTKTLPDVKI